jgi:glycosyltransferase involved in cell wall biosynthesis
LSRPFISVVMPVHRGGNWLDAALASIQSDVPGDIELVIRDSTPEQSRADVVASHAERLRIDYAYMPEVASWTRKTNLGVEAARADYVCTLHQDDLWLEGRLARAREMIGSFPDASLLLTPSLIVDDTGRTLGQWRPPFRPGRIAPTVYRDLLLVQNSIAMPAPIFRRDSYLAAGGLDESLWYTPDWDLWLKLGDQGPVVYDPQPATAFRVHGHSLTMNGDRREFAEQLEIVLARHLRAGSKTARISRASVRINTLLSEAALRNPRALLHALGTFLALGPINGSRYIRYSRIIDRVLPRLRLRFAGAL